MSRTIWKFPLVVTDEIYLEIPEGAVPLSVQMQHGWPCLWAIVDPAARKVKRRLQWRGTGHNADGLGVYVGTIQIVGGDLVFHLFDKGEE